MDAKNQVTVTVDNYFKMWNETDPVRRRAAVEAVWTPDAQSIDPLADVVGWQAIEQFVIGLQEQYPNHTVLLGGAVDHHHNRLRFPWAIKNPAGQVILSGLDCVRLASDGRIAELTGFFDGALAPPGQ